MNDMSAPVLSKSSQEFYWIERVCYETRDRINADCVYARRLWILSVSVQLVLLTSLSGITGRDLLLGNPVALSVMSMKLPQQTFFLWGPFVFTVFFFWAQSKLDALRSDLVEFDKKLMVYERGGHIALKRIRHGLDSFYLTQSIADPSKQTRERRITAVIAAACTTVMPLITLLYFEAVSLPLHDPSVTWMQRVCILLMALKLGSRAVSGEHFRFKTRDARVRSIQRLLAALGYGLGAFFSVAICTFPDEAPDIVMRAMWPVAAPAMQGDGSVRAVFPLTRALFEGAIDPGTGQASSPFHRNLVLNDEPVSTGSNQSARLNLRGRDLRYGSFDRIVLRNTDLSFAQLDGASLNFANLEGARLEEATFRKAVLIGTDLSNTVVVRTRFDGAALVGTKFDGFKYQCDPKDLCGFPMARIETPLGNL